MAAWLYPANVNMYKVMSAFEEKMVAWPINSKISIGDTVYIYLTAPYKKIGFVCDVIQINIPDSMISEYTRPYMNNIANSEKPKDKPFMMLGNIKSLLEGYDNGFVLDNLRENGLQEMLMGPRKLDNNPTLLKYIRGEAHELRES